MSDSASDSSSTLRTRVFPPPCPDARAGDDVLSILDATVANFSPCQAVWFFGPVTHPHSHVSPAQLKHSLEATLAVYAQWCGSLQWVKHDAKGGHTSRYGCLVLKYGTASDPGVEFTVAASSEILSKFLPSVAERKTKYSSWDASSVPSKDLLSPTPLAPTPSDPAAPCVTIQVTTFPCGATAIGIKLVHALADAQTLSRFTHDWASTTNAIYSKIPLPPLTPIFQPKLLDLAAAGDIDAPYPSPSLTAQARSLPCHRYDWFASNADSPFPARNVPEEVDPPMLRDAGTPMPWAEWDVKAPVPHYVLHFSSMEIARMWAACHSPSAPAPVSRHDALLAHVWLLVNRARKIDDTEEVHLDISVGVRQRLSPALPASFLGSPMFIADVAMRASTFAEEVMARTARQIRDVIARFDDAACRALLHDVAHELCAQRLWQAFLGRRHVIRTSWIHLGMYDVDFGTGRPEYVDAVMPLSDGIVEIMEAAAENSVGDLGGKSEEKNGESDGVRKSKHWTENGVDVSVYLESKAMERLILDPILRVYIRGQEAGAAES